jgi:hypothetical protein
MHRPRPGTLQKTKSEIQGKAYKKRRMGWDGREDAKNG